jgi:serine protease Do
MTPGWISTAILAGVLAVGVATADAAPVSPPADAFGGSLIAPAQAGPEGVPPPEATPAPETTEPEQALPPPILPAPDLPGDDPVVELPEAGEPPAVAPPGIPLTPDGRVFSFADLAERLLDSVVYISTSQRVTVSRRTPPAPTPESEDSPGEDFFDEFFDEEGPRSDPRTVQSLGSGFVIDPSGLIVTNNHVISEADEIVANFADGSKLVAEVIGTDDKTDLALLQVKADEPLKAATFGRSDSLRVGEWVLAIGNPFGFGGSVTAGIVSALDRDINSGPYDHYIQTDASINRGNSGGPLFNVGGEVVGINTAIMSPTGGSIGIGFAVPSEIAVPVIEQLRRFGEVRRGWIGVRIQNVSDEVAEGLGMERAVGAFIAGTTPDGPADKAGIQEGDVVVEFDGKPIDSMRALPRVVADTPPGETVDVTVMREGERVTLKIEVGLLDDEVEVAAATGDDEESESEEEGSSGAIPDDAAQMFGLAIGPITDDARATYSIAEGVQGVLVTAVEPGSEAEEKNLKPGDVIQQVAQEDVDLPEEVVTQIEKEKAAGRKTVLFLVTSTDNKQRFVSLRFEEPQ